MSAEAALLDTNVLIYALDPKSPFHAESRALLESARLSDAALCVTPQIIGEFYSVVTDRRRVPQPRTSSEALDAIEQILALPGIALLPTPVDSVERWTKLARQHPLTGPAIYDLQLVATLQAYEVQTVYTYNRTDFDRYAEMRSLNPSEKR